MRHSLPQWIFPLLAGSFILVTALGPSAAFAQSRRYSGSNSAPRTSGIGGSRTGSCTGEAQTSFTALAPIGHVGQTATTRPTVVLYVPDGQLLGIDFRIYQYSASGTLQPQPVYQTELTSQPGMMAVTLPGDQPELTVGQQYYWQAALICDPNHGSEDLIVSAEMKIVADTTPESERWYDLMATALRADAPTRTELLQNLAALEQEAADTQVQNQPERRRELLQHSEHLNEIIATER